MFFIFQILCNIIFYNMFFNQMVYKDKGPHNTGGTLPVMMAYFEDDNLRRITKRVLENL